jgi:hypothetical protein
MVEPEPEGKIQLGTEWEVSDSIVPKADCTRRP